LGEGGEQIPEAIAPVEQLVVVVTGARRLRQALEGLVELGADALGGVRAVLVRTGVDRRPPAIIPASPG
jgi:hypothetical protein